MTKVAIEIHDDVIEIYNKVKDINDTGIEIDIPKGSVLFDSTMNLKLLKRLIQKDGKVLTLTTSDEVGNNLLELIEEGSPTQTLPYEEYESKEDIKDKLRNIKIKNPFEGFNFNLDFKAIPLLIIIPLIILGLLGYLLTQKMYKANATLQVEAQTLTRSVTIKVKKDVTTDYEKNILKGVNLQSTVEGTDKRETTGEKIVGEKAEGELTIYNKTDEDVDFEKGDLVVFEKDDEEYKYKLTDDVTVPARVYEDVNDTEGTLGEADVEVEATDVGKEYNIDKGETLKFEDYKTSKYYAKSKADFEGGKSETIQAVNKTDVENLKKTVSDANKEAAQKALENVGGSETRYIKGSELLTTVKEEFSNKEGEETKELTFSQTVTAEGLAYSEKDLSNYLNNILKDLIPEGYEISEKDNEVKVEILGNSTSSVLNPTEADIQVTLKTYIVPKIDENKLKEDLKGKSTGDAQKVLGSIKNIKSYELQIVPNIPVFKKMPNDISKISITIEKK